MCGAAGADCASGVSASDAIIFLSLVILGNSQGMAAIAIIWKRGISPCPWSRARVVWDIRWAEHQKSKQSDEGGDIT